MKFRGRLATLLLLGALVTAGCTGGAEGGDKAGGGGEPVVLRMADTGARGGFSPAIEYFLQRVKELSGGELRIDVAYEWGSFAPDAEQQTVLDVAAGKADLTSAGPRVFDTLGVEGFQALTAPMLIDSYPLEDAVLQSDIPARMLTGLGKLEVTGLGVLGGSLNKPVAVEKPLLGPSDWQGITFESYRSQTQAKAIRALGAKPTDVFGAALEEGLGNGQIQGYSKGLLVYRINGREELAPYLTANVNLWPGMQIILANPRRLAQLTDEQRGWLTRAAHDAAARSTGLIEQEDQVVADVCQAGARFANASETDLAALRHAFLPVYASLEQDPQTKAFIERIDALKASTDAGPPLAIPPGCTGSVSEGQSNDPFTGMWQTRKITENDWVRVFIANGGSEKNAHETFGAKHYKVVALTFQDGAFKLYCLGDGEPLTEPCDTGTYKIGEGTVILDEACCPGTVTFRYDLSGDTLRLHFVKLPGDPEGATLFAGFPFTRSS